MNTCCPNCSSSAALGNEIASVCTDCVSVSMAGQSMSMALFVGITAGVIGVAYLARKFRRSLSNRLVAQRVIASV